VKLWRILVLVGIVIAAVVLIYIYRQPLGITGPIGGSQQSAVTGESAPSPAHIIWQKVDRSPDGFTVEMPSDVKQIQIPAYNQNGGADQVNMIYTYPGSETTYSVTWADDPPVSRYNGGSPERTLDMARDNALARTQCSLVGETRSNLQGYPVRNFSGQNEGGGVFNARLILVRNRLYMLIAAFPASSARRDRDVTRFFDSFSVASNARND
jgi:hypothetical protein